MLQATLLATLIFSQSGAGPQPGLSPRWLEAGLHLRLRDSVALLDSIGEFALQPPLAFPAKHIETRTGPSIAALPTEKGKLSVLTWGSGTSMAFHFDPTTASIDPAKGSLRFERMFALVFEQRLSHLPELTSRPRRPVTALWSLGSWSVAPQLTKGAGQVTIPLRIAGTLAALRLDQAQWVSGGWNIGTGPHLLEWLDKPHTGHIDTLKGPLRLELAKRSGKQAAGLDSLDDGPSRIVGYGGGSLMGGRFDAEKNRRELRRLGEVMRLGAEAEGLSLDGMASWIRPGRISTGRLVGTSLLMDTARLPTGERVLGAHVAPSGQPRDGTLLDSLAIPVPGGVLRIGTGTLLVQGLPALGGPGERRLVTDLGADLRTWIGLDSSRLFDHPLHPAPPSTRMTATSQRLTYLDQGMVVSGRLAVQRQEQDDQERELPDRFVTVLDSISIRLPGMTDTLGGAADTVLANIGSEELFRSGYSTSTWQYLGPWRQWSDSARPWLVWRFRPGLGRYGESYQLRAESLMVAWKGAAFRRARPGTGPSYSFGFVGGTFRCREQGQCPGIALPVPAGTAAGRPWPGLGIATADTLLRLDDTVLSATMRLEASPDWRPLLGREPVRVDVRGTPARRSDGSWGMVLADRPSIAIRPRAGQFLSSEHATLLDSGDSAILSSSGGNLRLELHWDESFDSPGFTGTPWKDGGVARLLSLVWTGDTRGGLDTARETWEPIVRPLTYHLPDGSELRGTEPLRVLSTRNGDSRTTEVRAKGLVLVRKGKAFPLPQDTVAHLDAKGRLVETVGAQTVTVPSVQERNGRVAIPLKDGTVLKVDRTEVTRTRWAECVNAGACQPLPDDSCRLRSRSSRPGDSLRWHRIQTWRHLDPMPATCLTPEEAEGFCHWSNGHLPTAGQYGRLAEASLSSSMSPQDRYWPINTLGMEGISGPWKPGGEDPFPDLAPPGSLRPLNPGIYDLAGNVDEWCTEGGEGRSDAPYGFHCRTRKAARRDRLRESTLGFRCVEE